MDNTKSKIATDAVIKRLMCRLMSVSIVLISVLLLCSSVSAEEIDNHEGKTVRVACGINNVLYLDEDGNPQGCCAKYLEELAKINNWRYEYVEDSWTNCYSKFINGDIDLLLPVQPTSERKEIMNFPNLDVGYQMIALFAPKNSDICYEEFDSFNGKRIAVTPQSINDSMLREYAQNNGFSYVTDYIETSDDKKQALESGEADLLLLSTVNDVDNLKLVAIIQTMPFYFTVSKDNPELFAELNYGMEKLLINESDLVNDTRNSTIQTGAAIAFTKAESDYIASSGKVVVGFYADTTPLADIHKEDGGYYGIYIEVLKRIEKETGLDIELYPIARDQYGLDLVRNGTIDFIIGSSDAQITALSVNDLVTTESIMDYNTVAVSKQNFKFDEEAPMTFVLTSARQYWQDYIYSKFPNASIIYCKSAKDCLDLITKGKADVTLLNTIEYNYQSKNPRFSGLIEWESLRLKSNTVMVCAASVDPLLLSIINKEVNHISSNEIQDIIYYYLNIPYHTYSIEDKIYSLRTPFIFAFCFLLCALLILINYSRIRKKSFRKLEQKNRELEVANAAKSDFLSRMSHDIRTPMNGIIGMTLLASDNNNPPDTQECLKKITVSSNYLLSLLNDILDLNKVESGKISLNLQPYPVGKFNQYVESVIRPMCDQHGLKLTIDVTHNIPEEKCVSVDVLRVNQMFFNLVSNASKYSSEGGTVAICIWSEDLGENSVYLHESVKDSGIGISEEFQKHMFESFTQEEQTVLPQRQGSGLGLAIVKSLITLMGGTVDVESKLGQGSTFTLNAIVKLTDAPEMQAGKGNFSDRIDYSVLRDKNILLCEDHPLNTEIAVRLLKKQGVNVTTAENGEIGVRLMENSTVNYFDAILMDIRMPVKDGVMATKCIRNLNREDAETIPIIAMTANAFDQDVRHYLAEGMNAHIAKPIDPTLLYQTLADFFDRK